MTIFTLAASMGRRAWWSLPVLLLLPAALAGAPAAQESRAAAPAPPGAGAPADEEFFEKQIRPLFAARCAACHGAAAKPPKGGLRMDSRAALLKGGDHGPTIVPGDPERSLLLQALHYRDPKLQMPPGARLPAAQIALVEEWVKRGAPWPEIKSSVKSQKSKEGASGAQILKTARARHWAFQPLGRPAVPKTRDAEWVRNPVDAFVLAKLEAKGIVPAPEADRWTLIRRVTFDLTGLPPTPEEAEAFVADRAPDAYEKVVERLLASPHYGERWGRHWLDLVRYAETDGHEFDLEKPNAWEYRDYVIRALNADVPYDQFVREHLAGDLLPTPRRHPSERFNESLIGSGYWFLGEGTHSPVDLQEDQAGRIDNQIDVFSKTFVGLSVGCARCHDHKFDPIPTKDYYALAGFLKSSRYHFADVNPREPVREAARELQAIHDRLQPRLAQALVTGGSLALAAGLAPAGDPPGAVVFAEFERPGYPGWFVTDEAFGAGPTRQAEVRLAADGALRLGGVLPAGVADSGALSDHLEGTLRSPSFTIEKGKILYRMTGRDSQLNLIIENFQRIRDPLYGRLTIRLQGGGPLKWYAQDVTKFAGMRAYLEFVDYGPGFIAIDRVLFADDGPPAEAPHKNPPALALSGAARSEVEALLTRQRRVEMGLPHARRVMAIHDGTPEDDRVHLRGSHRTLGEVVPRRFLQVLGGPEQPPVAAGSGRLELAERLLRHPLTARVMVNRVWQHHFGEGIVRTPDDFGVRGERPTHPELLDWLASEFTAGTADGSAREQVSRGAGENSGPNSSRTHSVGALHHPSSPKSPWSLKSLHRLIVTSATYRQASRGSVAGEAADPQNRLLHRAPVRRLEAEAVRDAILATSGRLDRTLYGPSVLPHLTPFMEGRGRPDRSGPLDGEGRRTIYLGVRRNFLTPMLLAFDFPVPFSTMGRRSVSTVPAQALTLLNNPFVVQQAGVWGSRVATEKEASVEARARQMYLTAFSRPPTPAEVAAARAFLAEQGGTPGSAEEQRAWGDLAHVLINAKEFISVR